MVCNGMSFCGIEVIGQSQTAPLQTSMYKHIYVIDPLSCLVRCPGQNKRIAPLSFFHGCRKVPLPKIDCGQTTMGLSPITSAVLLITK
jgi:hypothetical protein